MTDKGVFIYLGSDTYWSILPKEYNGSSYLFIWMTTCIPNCAQIVNNLGFIELSENQPDLVVCVSCSFETIACRYQKSLHFMFTFVYMNVIEFPKWGLLPYCHILIIWVEDKVRNRKQANRLIPAEIQKTVENRKLYERFRWFITHRSCGTINLNCVCMENGKYYKRQSKTSINLSRYWVYYEKCHGSKVRVG